MSRSEAAASLPAHTAQSKSVRSDLRTERSVTITLGAQAAAASLAGSRSSRRWCRREQHQQPLRFRTSRRAPHNLYTRTRATSGQSPRPRRSPAGLPGTIFRFPPGDPIAGTVSPATEVDIDYGRTTVSYGWNGTGWDRTQDGSPVDTDGIRTSPTTVVVQITDTASLPPMSGRPKRSPPVKAKPGSSRTGR